VPGSVKVIGRRQIEMYSRLIHTVDHIEGRLRDDMDAFDGFRHTPGPSRSPVRQSFGRCASSKAMKRAARLWYGGAIGMVGFNGDMNTGLTLRTIASRTCIAEVAGRRDVA